MGEMYQRERYKARKEIKDRIRAERGSLDEAIDLVQRYWTLGVVRILEAGPLRFSDIELGLGASVQALEVALGRMIEKGLVTREPYDEFPPRVEYALTERGRGLLPVVAALEEWANG